MTSLSDLVFAPLNCFQGLGTSTNADAVRYFKDMKNLVKTITWTEDSGELIDRSFNKSRASERKEWISAYEPGHHIDHTKPEVSIADFIDKELILFSRYDVERSIPSVVDGLKPSQRKILYAAFKKNLTTEIKVAQFGSYVAEHTGYHHGEVSLQGAIINMAQDYVGSNNVPWLNGVGQFGSRHVSGGHDHASARYIYTKLNKITRKVFVDTDDKLLDYLEDDGETIEPRYYVPTIPTLLVNGTSGISTGFSTDVPCYNPKDIVDNVKRLIRGEDMKQMIPWYRGFKGTIEETTPGVIVTKGLYTVKGKTIAITELPLGKYLQDFKEYLDSLVEKKIIIDFREKHTVEDVLFEIDFQGEPDTSILKLESSIRTSNMHAFDPFGKIKKYNTPLEIIMDWYSVRNDLYVDRKKYLLDNMSHRSTVAANKYRFITMITEHRLVVNNKGEQTIIKELDELKFYRVDGKYEYLLNMKISSLTAERAEALKKEAEELEKELEILKNTTETQMWISDIDILTTYM